VRNLKSRKTFLHGLHLIALIVKGAECNFDIHNMNAHALSQCDMMMLVCSKNIVIKLSILLIVLHPSGRCQNFPFDGLEPENIFFLANPNSSQARLLELKFKIAMLWTSPEHNWLLKCLICCVAGSKIMTLTLDLTTLVLYIG